MEESSAKFRRLHPLTFVHYIFLAIVGFAFTLFSSPDESGGLYITILVFAILYTLILGPYAIAQYIRFRYHVTCEELIIHYGVFKRVQRNIPSERIQNVRIERNMLSRILGTSSVKIETAGSSGAEGVLSYVGVREAERIRNLLRNAIVSEDQARFSMPLKRVLLSSIYQFSLGIFGILIGTFYSLESLKIIDSTVIANWLMEQNFLIATGTERWPLLIAILLLIISVLGWGLGFIENLVRFYNFQIQLGPKKIHRKFGLLTLREGTLSYKRVQSFLIRSNPLMRLHHWHRLDMQTLGLESGERGFQPAMPFAKWSEITTLARRIHRFILPDTYTHVSRLTLRRHIFRYCLLILIFAIVLSLLWDPFTLWGLCLIPVTWGTAKLQYTCHHWSFHDGHLLIRRRFISQQFWIVPVERFQAFEIKASPFQRYLGLCTLIVDTAGAGILRYPRIIDMKRDDAEQLLLRLQKSSDSIRISVN